MLRSTEEQFKGIKAEMDRYPRDHDLATKEKMKELQPFFETKS